MNDLSFRYTEDEDGWITGVYFGCMSGNCYEFIGNPTDYGYLTWEEWADNVCLNAWRVTIGEDGYQLHHDASREEELLALYEQRKEENKIITKGALESDIFNLVTRSGSREGMASIGNLAFEWGTVSVTSGDTLANETYSGSAGVKFTRVFSQVPGILTSFGGSYQDLRSVSYYSASKTGFSVAVRLAAPNTTRTVQWLAVGIINSKALG